MTLLQLRKIHKRYRSLQALEDIHLDIATGHTLGIIGKSGCGKSTLAKIMMHLEAPDQGYLYFAGQRVDQMDRKQLLNFRKNVQMVFQNPYSSLNPYHTIETILLEPFYVHKLPPKNLDELLELMKLPKNCLHRFPHEFSGGERQRIAIARAMSLHPKCLILDEPTSALDVAIATQIIDTLMELKKEYKLAMVFISHDLAHVRHFCDSILLMDQGKILESQPAEVFFQNPQTEEASALIQCAQLLDHMQTR